jgi:hypothetical protein
MVQKSLLSHTLEENYTEWRRSPCYHITQSPSSSSSSTHVYTYCVGVKESHCMNPFSINVLLTVHHGINVIPVTTLMHKFLYSYNVTVLYMFRAVICSSSGGQIVCIQHMVSSLCKQVSGLVLLKYCLLCHNSLW